MTPMALNIKSIEGPRPAYDIEDTYEANRLVEAAGPGKRMDLNLREEKKEDLALRAAKLMDQKQKQLWYKKLWMISRV